MTLEIDLYELRKFACHCTFGTDCTNANRGIVQVSKVSVLLKERKNHCIVNFSCFLDRIACEAGNIKRAMSVLVIQADFATNLV